MILTIKRTVYPGYLHFLIWMQYTPCCIFLTSIQLNTPISLKHLRLTHSKYANMNHSHYRDSSVWTTLVKPTLTTNNMAIWLILLSSGWWWKAASIETEAIWQLLASHVLAFLSCDNSRWKWHSTAVSWNNFHQNMKLSCHYPCAHLLSHNGQVLKGTSAGSYCTQWPECFTSGHTQWASDS